MARFFTPDYVERAVLRDGTVVRLRLTVPEDKAILRHGFERWSPESRYARFLVPKQRLTDAELDYLCDIDQESHFSIGAVAEDGDGHGEPVGLGIARFIRLRTQPGEPAIAEAAIAVADEAAGKGLGRLMFLRLCAAAIERGIQRFRCEVLCSNHSMQGLIETIAPAHTTTVESGVTTIDFDIAPIAPDAPATTEPASPMYQFFRAAAEGAVEWTDSVRRFWRG
jgi:GNAT superfamily N-acetyltransferase